MQIVIAARYSIYSWLRASMYLSASFNMAKFVNTWSSAWWGKQTPVGLETTKIILKLRLVVHKQLIGRTSRVHATGICRDWWRDDVQSFHSARTWWCCSRSCDSCVVKVPLPLRVAPLMSITRTLSVFDVSSLLSRGWFADLRCRIPLEAAMSVNEHVSYWHVRHTLLQKISIKFSTSLHSDKRSISQPVSSWILPLHHQ